MISKLETHIIELRCSIQKMTIQFILFLIAFLEIGVVYFYFFDSEINFNDFKILVYLLMPAFLISFIRDTISLKDFLITNEGMEVTYTIYKWKIVLLKFKDVKTLRFDIAYNPRRRPKLTIFYLNPTLKEKIIEFNIIFKYEDLVKTIEFLRGKGIHVICTENLDVK